MLYEGTSGNDAITASPYNDVIFPDEGNDTVYALAGNDEILVKGGDNDPDKIPGGDCVRANGGEVRVLSYVSGVSTTEIIGTIRGRT